MKNVTLKPQLIKSSVKIIPVELAKLEVKRAQFSDNNQFSFLSLIFFAILTSFKKLNKQDQKFGNLYAEISTQTKITDEIVKIMTENASFSDFALFYPGYNTPPKTSLIRLLRHMFKQF